MARFEIRTRTNGVLKFFVPDSGGYVRLESADHPGTLGRQICEGGRFHGSTVMASSETLEIKARRWYRAFRRAQRANKI